MNELDVWVCFGGDEPDSIRELLDLVREPEAVDEPDWEALSQRVIASLRGGQLHGGSVVAAGVDQKEERTESEEALAPTVMPSALAEGLAAAPPIPALPDVVAALLGSGATGAEGATGAAGAAGVGAVGLPKTSLSLDVAGAMRDRRPAPVVVVEEAPAPAPEPHTMRVVAIAEAREEGEARGEARREVRADFKTTMMHDGARIAAVVAALAQQQQAGEGRLTLERYASVLVELRLGYERRGVLGRYDLLGEGAMEREEAYWEGRMAREPGLKGALKEAEETWEGYLRGRGGGGG